MWLEILWHCILKNSPDNVNIARKREMEVWVSVGSRKMEWTQRWTPTVSPGIQKGLSTKLKMMQQTECKWQSNKLNVSAIIFFIIKVGWLGLLMDIGSNKPLASAYSLFGDTFSYSMFEPILLFLHCWNQNKVVPSFKINQISDVNETNSCDKLLLLFHCLI